jgi:RNA polymerase-binding transcription factor DksA
LAEMPWQKAHAAFMAELRSVAADPARLAVALQSKTVEQMVNALLADTCDAHGLQVSEFFRNFERDRAAQRQLELIMRGLLNSPSVMELRRPALLHDVRRELLLLDFALSGDEPPEGTWESMEPSEQHRVRHASSTMKGSDPELLARVRRALSRAVFGTCEGCGKPIPVGRLQLIAAAERCAPCQALLESAPPPPAQAAQVHHFARRA